MLDHYKAVSPGAMRGVGSSGNLQPLDHAALVRHARRLDAPDSAALFARFCDRARHLADGMAYAVTLNEANGTLLGHVMAPPGQGRRARHAGRCRRATGSDHFVGGSPISLAMEMLP
jgi:hypothetical protein